MSRRYYTRETSGKAAPFAIPYNGEEVKLHWANADQYYIKTAEYFSNFTFDITQAADIRQLSSEERTLQNIPEQPLKVHFRVIDAAEGEHGNIKATEATKRFFILHANQPVEQNEAGELVVNFEYRPDPGKTGQEGSWRDKRNVQTVKSVLEQLEELSLENKGLAEYLRLLNFSAPTDKNKKRPLLAKYVNQYTARNSMDYFIHKDLGGFLRRELDFYIKNEVMRLDDIENADVPAVESYLSRIKVLRKIAGKLIDFLAQLEGFQKKLWLKKKFVVETNYCITLDRVPEELYPQIAQNEAQIEEWVELFAIDEIAGDLAEPGFSRPLTVEFLKNNDKLVLDTRFFAEDFKAQLIDSIENFDEQCNGLLIHSENFQALNTLSSRIAGCVDVVFAGSGTTGHAVINLNREDNGKRKYILVEMGDYFDTVLKPRIAKVVYSDSWKDGKPTARNTGISHCFKYIRLESYEDTLNNLHLDENPVRDKAVAANASLKEDYMLRYLLDVETRGSQSLLNIDAFADPCRYTLNVKKPGSDESVTKNVDLIETFNYLLGLRLLHLAAPQQFTAQFKRIEDPEIPSDQNTKLVIDGKIKQIDSGVFWFRRVEGWVPSDLANPNNGQQEKVLIVWRKLSGDLEKDNAVLDAWFQENLSSSDFEFDTIYVNGSNNLPNLKRDGDNWKVRLIEEEFHKKMWEVDG